jgi:hypothetical protein
LALGLAMPMHGFGASHLPRLATRAGYPPPLGRVPALATAKLGGMGRATPSPGWRQGRVPGLALARVAGAHHPLFLGEKRAGGPTNTTWGSLTCSTSPNTPAIALAGPCQSHYWACYIGTLFFIQWVAFVKKKVEDPFYFYKILLFKFFFFWGCLRQTIASFHHSDSTYSFL